MTDFFFLSSVFIFTRKISSGVERVGGRDPDEILVGGQSDVKLNVNFEVGFENLNCVIDISKRSHSFITID